MPRISCLYLDFIGWMALETDRLRPDEHETAHVLNSPRVIHYREPHPRMQLFHVHPRVAGIPIRWSIRKRPIKKRKKRRQKNSLYEHGIRAIVEGCKVSWIINDLVEITLLWVPSTWMINGWNNAILLRDVKQRNESLILNVKSDVIDSQGGRTCHFTPWSRRFSRMMIDIDPDLRYRYLCVLKIVSFILQR